MKRKKNYLRSRYTGHSSTPFSLFKCMQLHLLWNSRLQVKSLTSFSTLIYRRPSSVLCHFFLFTFLKVGQLRQRFHHSIAPGGLAADRRGVVPASGFCLSAVQIWKVIRQNKDLNLPAHKVTFPFFVINAMNLNSYNCTWTCHQFVS